MYGYNRAHVLTCLCIVLSLTHGNYGQLQTNAAAIAIHGLGLTWSCMLMEPAYNITALRLRCERLQ